MPNQQRCSSESSKQ